MVIKGKFLEIPQKAMNRRARQEREAQEKAYFRYEGGRRDPRYRERLAEIDRRYDHKRNKVERHLCNDEELESAPTEPSGHKLYRLSCTACVPSKGQARQS